MNKLKYIFIVCAILGMCVLLLASAEAAILLTRPGESSPHPLGQSAYKWMIAVLPGRATLEPLPTQAVMPTIQQPGPLPTFQPTWTIEAQPTLPALTITPVYEPLATYTPMPTSTPLPTRTATPVK